MDKVGYRPDTYDKGIEESPKRRDNLFFRYGAAIFFALLALFSLAYIVSGFFRAAKDDRA